MDTVLQLWYYLVLVGMLLIVGCFLKGPPATIEYTFEFEGVHGANFYEIEIEYARGSDHAEAEPQILPELYPPEEKIRVRVNPLPFYIRIRAVDGDGNRGPWSPYSELITPSPQ